MTLVSHRARFIFLKTHKTGSTSVEVALEPLCAPEGAETGREYRPALVTEAGIVGARGRVDPEEVWRNHMSARAVRRLVGRDVWRGYAKIAVVRNPYDRFVSMFHSRLPPTRRAELAAAPFEEARAAFRAWLPAGARANVLSKIAIGGRLALDRVLFFERLEEDFAALAADL
ncbi:MAG: sulfotransferase family 2 domain-containing protein, partial [Pseudomonadota bacterium]